MRRTKERATMPAANFTEMWARIQEGLLSLIDHATALGQMMDRSPTTALNPARIAMSQSLDRHIAAARRELEQIVKELSAAERETLFAELEEVRRIRKAKGV
jgi:hypothetical protein